MQFLKRLSQLSTLAISRPSVSLTRTFSILNRANPSPTPVLLTVQHLQLQVQPAAGFKVRVNLKKRCKDCYFVRRQDRLFVICPTQRRHKQMQMVKDERNTWTLTAATQGKIRHW